METSDGVKREGCVRSKVKPGRKCSEGGLRVRPQAESGRRWHAPYILDNDTDSKTGRKKVLTPNLRLLLLYSSPKLGGSASINK